MKKGETIQVENYQLGEKLGKGAFGVVYKGLDITTGQFVAVKRLPRSTLDAEALQVGHREPSRGVAACCPRRSRSYPCFTARG